MDDTTRWQAHALWHLGELTNVEYADYLVAQGEEEDSPVVQILRRTRDRLPQERSTVKRTRAYFHHFG